MKMERDSYLKKCRDASVIMGTGAWWEIKWKPENLVKFRGDMYIPVDYQFGFKGGNITGVAVLQSTKSNSVVYAALKDVVE